MINTRRSCRSLDFSLMVVLAVVLVLVSSCSAVSKTTCQTMKGPNGGKLTIQTTITYTAPRAPRKCIRTKNDIIVQEEEPSISPQTPTETTSNNSEDYVIEHEVPAANPQTPTETTSYNSEDYVIEHEVPAANPQTPTETNSYNSEDYVIEHEEPSVSPKKPTETNSNNGEEYSEDFGEVRLTDVYNFTIAPATTEPTTSEIRSDYTYFPSVGAYKFHNYKKEWYEAEGICEEEGGHLAIIDTVQEMDVVRNYLSQETDLSHDIFIGFSLDKTRREFYTVQGESMNLKDVIDSFAPFMFIRTEFCGALRNGGKIDIIPCLSRDYFLCELPL